MHTPSCKAPATRPALHPILVRNGASAPSTLDETLSRSSRSGEVLDEREDNCLLKRSYRKNTGMYIVKCYIGFCTPTRTEMDTKKKKSHVIDKRSVGEEREDGSRGGKKTASSSRRCGGGCRDA